MSDLDRQVAEALNWKFDTFEIYERQTPPKLVIHMNDCGGRKSTMFIPSTDWDQAGYLLEKYKIRLSYCHFKPECKCKGWMADIYPHEFNIQATTPQEAICRAVIQLEATPCQNNA